MQISSRFRSFLADRRGNAMMAFTLSVPVMFGMAGAAVDYSRLLAVKQSVQGSLDASLLAAARSERLDDTHATTTVSNFLSDPGVAKHDAQLSNISAAVEDGNTVRGEVTISLPTTLLNVVGLRTLQMRLSAKVARGLGNVEIALVLDSTKSMEGTRLASVKTAANELIDTLFALPDADSKVKVSVVPFAQYVNVGMANRYASWMDVPADTSTTSTVCYDTYPNATKSNCRMVTYTAYNDGVPFTYTVEECDWNYGTPVNVCAPYTTTVTWNGCAGARSIPLNIKDEQYSTRIPGIRNVSCPGAILPLSRSSSDIKASINGMTAYGETYIPTGLTWGWRTLSNRAPFTESADDPVTANAAPRKYLVLMTDGFNTRSPRFPEGDHEGWDGTLSNQLTKDVCDNIKADTESRIDIYTIAFEVTDEGIKDILRYCATPGGAFFDAVDYSRLVQAFSDIGSSISVARISR